MFRWRLAKGKGGGHGSALQAARIRGGAGREEQEPALAAAVSKAMAKTLHMTSKVNLDPLFRGSRQSEPSLRRNC